ncbi:aminotransferase class V-fold PLP-dependent enzyme [Streptomyces sp. BHT-5-2]|uniref:aminotransferase class V-fold PLP-dependent enzyme n=1 Tax=Streptomyces sp. BHT-5-2 TaxID=2866715 RepID=UPI001C8D65E4|nr:aminotransferase class V-fold PLP-dependent enzyme [Streptomyces sp. BHT-5-2]QZL06047.1 aminotransferase class V-fold PLP-dependent enzyme [Streptomyces sp. BHT-5-2]
MQRHTALGGDEFAPETVYLNSASSGLLPARSAAAVTAALAESASYGTMGRDYFEAAARARGAFARLMGVPEERVALGSSVAVQSAFVAGALPPGSEVLVAEGDFSSLVNPLAARADCTVRAVPREVLADAVRPRTALVAVSAVHALDGRLTDLAAVRDAARAHGALTYVDATQAAGWLPLPAADFDYVVCGAFKWLLCPRGTTFMVFGGERGEPGGPGWPVPAHAGWIAGEDPGESNYGVVDRPAATARRYDEPYAHYSYVAAEHSLGLLAELGVDTVHAHNTALADRYRAGLTAAGFAPRPAPGSAIVSTPGLVDAEPRLARAGVRVSVRGGLLRAAFHLYNSAADVDRALSLLVP